MTQNTITLIVLAVLVVFSLPALYRKKKSGDLTLWGKGRRHKAGEYCKDLIAKYYPYFPIDRKSTRLNSSHPSRIPSSA